MKKTLLILLLFTSACNALAEGNKYVWVHITGFVNKPGRYKVASDASPHAILKSCTGSSTFGALKRVHVIRLDHRRKNIPKREKAEVFYYDFRKAKSIPLQHGDLIFVPQKRTYEG